MKNILFCSFAILLIVRIACKNSNVTGTSVEPEHDFGTYEIASFMPLAIGNQWIYVYDSPFEHAILDMHMKDSLYISGPLLLFGYSEDVQVATPPQNSAIAGYLGYRGGTVYSVAVQGFTLASKIPLLASPIIVGHTWWTDAAGYRDSFEIISTNPGQFGDRAIDTVVCVRWWNDFSVDSMWFARSVGLLRHTTTRGSYRSTKQLNSFTIAP